MKRLGTAAVGLLLTAACGTTVPLTSSATVGTQGAGSTGSGSTGTGPAALGTGSTGATASGATGATANQGGSTGVSVGGTNGGSATTGSATTGVSLSQGARDTAPLKVGVLTTDLGAAVKALGANPQSNRKSDDGYRAIITELNKTGGLAGRKLVPNYQVVEATDNNYQGDSDKACAAFGDAHEEVVLSDSASTDYGLAACLAREGIPMITSVPSDNKGFAGAPSIFNAFNPSFDRGYGAVVDDLVASGYLTTKSKIGVIRIDCAAITAAYENTVLPRMRAARLVTPLEYTVPCASGFQDAGAYSAAMGSAVLRFQSSQVDRVFVLGSQENLLLQYFAEQAQQQQYHPGYALSSSSFPITLIGASTFPQQQLPQVHGAGWHPQGDANIDPKSPAERRCVSLSSKGGVVPANITEVYALYQACSNIFLLEAAMLHGTGQANGSELRAVIPALGTSFASTGILDGETLFGPHRQDGPQLAREWGYVSSCSCFRYLGSSRVMT